MKICYLFNILTSHGQKSAQAMAQRGHEVHVISINHLAIEGVKVHSVRISGNPQTFLTKLLSYFKLLFTINKLIQHVQPDILHAHNVTTNGVIGALSGFHPYIITALGLEVFDYGYYRLLHPLNRYAFSKADAITSFSHTMTPLVKKFAPQDVPVTTVPFGVDVERFAPIRSEMQEDDVIRIGFLKSLKSVYGLEYLIEAFAIVGRTYPNTQLLVAGDGPLMASMRQLCEDLSLVDKVVFLGRIPHAQASEFLSRLSIFAMPSLLESLGVSALEASAVGVPVVASNTGGIPEVVLDGITGYLVPPKDVETIVDRLITLIEDVELRRRMGRAGREFVVENYDWSESVRKMIGLYASVLGKHPKEILT